jgi:hypothetical protein
MYINLDANGTHFRYSLLGFTVGPHYVPVLSGFFSEGMVFRHYGVTFTTRIVCVSLTFPQCLSAAHFRDRTENGGWRGGIASCQVRAFSP